MITWRGLGPPQREPAPCEGRLPRQFSEYMANTHMAKANKYQVHRKGGKVANNVFFAELALMGGWRHLARESLLRFCQSCSSIWLSYNYENDHLLNPSWFRGNALACHLGAKSCILRKCKRWTVHSALLAHKAQCTSCTVHFLHSARIAQCHCISCTVHILHSTQCKVHILHLLVAPLSST